MEEKQVVDDLKRLHVAVDGSTLEEVKASPDPDEITYYLHLNDELDQTISYCCGDILVLRNLNGDFKPSGTGKKYASISSALNVVIAIGVEHVIDCCNSLSVFGPIEPDNVELKELRDLKAYYESLAVAWAEAI